MHPVVIQILNELQRLHVTKTERREMLRAVRSAHSFRTGRPVGRPRRQPCDHPSSDLRTKTSTKGGKTYTYQVCRQCEKEREVLGGQKAQEARS